MRAALAALLVVLGLATAVEVGLRAHAGRLTTPLEDLRTAYDPASGYRLVKGQGVNAQGFRGRPFTVAKPPGLLRIFCVGESSTFGTGVPPEQAYPARLQQLLERQAVQPLEVINAGVPGYGSKQNLVHLQTRIADLEPDLVILLQGNNDVFFFEAEPLHHRIADSYEVQAFFPPPSWHQWLLKHSLAWRTLAAQLVLRHLRQHRRTTLDPRGLDAFRKNVRNAVRWAREAEVPLLMVTYPSLWSLALRNGGGLDDDGGVPGLRSYLAFAPLSLAAIAEGLAVYNQIVRDIAREHGVPLLDLAAELPEDVSLYVGDPIHFSAKGCQEVAERVARALRTSGLFPTRTASP